jgi:hypothetical protein
VVSAGRPVSKGSLLPASVFQQATTCPSARYSATLAAPTYVCAKDAGPDLLKGLLLLPRRRWCCRRCRRLLPRGRAAAELPAPAGQRRRCCCRWWARRGAAD